MVAKLWKKRGYQIKFDKMNCVWINTEKILKLLYCQTMDLIVFLELLNSSFWENYEVFWAVWNIYINKFDNCVKSSWIEGFILMKGKEEKSFIPSNYHFSRIFGWSFRFLMIILLLFGAFVRLNNSCQMFYFHNSFYVNEERSPYKRRHTHTNTHLK